MEHTEKNGEEPEWVPNEQDFRDDESLVPRTPGILEQPPPRSHLNLVLACYFVCVIISLIRWDARLDVEFWVSQGLIFKDHVYWRLFSALAAHANWEHLLGNAPLFVIFGWLLRSYFGLWFFPILPVLLGALANLLTVLNYAPEQRLLGCSGMVYAMVALWLVLYMRHETRYSFFMRLFRCLGFSMILLLPSSFHPTTSYLAHAFGFALGLLGAYATLVCMSLFNWLAKVSENNLPRV
jgi:rhomboid protease GluP